jgi:type IV pilus assembly protein PilB
MNTTAPRVLGQLLLSSHAVDAETLDSALAEQRRTRERLGQVLARLGVDPEAIAKGLAAQLRLEYAEPPIRSDDAALRLVAPKLAERLRVVPVTCNERRVRIAMADPLDADAIDDLQFQTGRRVEPLVASVRAIEIALAAYQPGVVESIVGRIGAGRAGRITEQSEVAALRRASQAAPIVSLVDLVLARAVKAGASDVHIEPAGDSLRIRIRVDGVLRELMILPAHAAGAFASRIKVMADMDIAVKRRPQDGRAVVRVEDRELGLRVSTLPAHGGEKTVIRILDPSNAGRALEDLGFEGDTLDRFVSLLGASHGVILVTGPTGSGKTTTLYSALARLDRNTKNVVTLEDPIEYRLPGLTQVQVHRRAGLGFAAALRAVLRQDPDVIMVGELRDRETAEVAMSAAMTGHLVLSTVHTNDAPSAATRLIDMGTPAWLIGAGLIGILAQRLVRRLCRNCRTEQVAPGGRLVALGLPATDTAVFEPGGCHRCEGTGYSGRLGIHEMLVVDGPIRKRLIRGASTESVRGAARSAGMRNLAQAAWSRVVAGETSIDEVRPILGLLAREAGGGQGPPPGAGAAPSAGEPDNGTGSPVNGATRQLEA